MKKIIKQKFKKGAASFYIVAFSTLILLIIATSFAAIIISELTRTSNDDLAQSAYDSALAGIEDAKLAIYDYQNCKSAEDPATLSTNSNKTCSEIIEKIEITGNDNGTDADTIEQKCNMTADILGRVPDNGGVPIQETEYSSTQGAVNNMQQAYTCVQIQNILPNYKGTLSPSSQIDVIEPTLAKDTDNNGNEVSIADRVGKVKISWYDDQDEPDKNNYNYGNFVSNTVAFGRLGTIAVPAPPTISLAMIQTAQNFSFGEFDTAVGDTTDKGMIYLVPTNGQKPGDGEKYQKSTWDASQQTNTISKSAWTKSNNKEAKNLPYSVNCPKTGGGYYACSATVQLPHPVNYNATTNPRNGDTFRFVVSLPYGTPSTTFELELICARDDGSEYDCYQREDLQGDGGHRAMLENVQIEIDSTGRANDLYRRVQARVKSSSDNSNLSIMGPLELLSGASSASLEKNYAVTSEYNFIP